MTERTEFKIIANLSVTPRVAEKDDDAVINGFAYEGDVLLCRRDNQKVVAIINANYLFDEFGNRFSY